MHKVIKYLLLLSLFFGGFSTQQYYAQNFADKEYYLIDSLNISEIGETDRVLLDSCLTLYHQTKNDTDKVKAILTIVEESWDENIWPKYNYWLHDYTLKQLKANPNKSITRKLSLVHASTINNIGYLNSIKGNTPEALKFYLKSLEIQEEFNDQENIPTSLNNIGAIYNKFGDIPKALEYYHKSLQRYKNYDNEQGLAQTLNNIGHIYSSQGERDLSLEYFHRSLRLFKKLKNSRGEATLLNSIGYVYFYKENHPKALNYYNEALNIRTKINDQKGIAVTLNNMAAVYENQKEIQKAMEHYNKSLAIYESINSEEGLSVTLGNIGRMYLDQGNISKAKVFAIKSLNIAKKAKMPDNIRASAKTLSLIYEKAGDTGKALEMYKLFTLMKDSVNNEKTQKATTKLQAKYEYETSKAIDDAENDKLLAIEQEKKEKQTVISYAAGIGLVLVIIFLLFVGNRLQITKKQKIVIEVQNKEIVDSITYAKRIQDAILPTNKWVKECLPESFIYYQPKDIVAGDFYWVESVLNSTSLGGTKQSAQKDEIASLHPETFRESVRHDDKLILFAAADCTGHGVPGAMVSVVCHNALNRVIGEFNIAEPGKILDKTREIIVAQLSKSENATIETIGNIRDGMDIALCLFNPTTKQLKYAGAHNPLWIIRKEAEEIEEIKASKQAVGKVEDPQPYVTHTVQLNKGDTIYLFSDGFADQFGGEKGKKLKSKPFKQLLVSNVIKPMDEQQALLNTFFNKWKGDLEQIDDVCVVGVRV